jgi:hypothetical protein
MRPWRSHLVQRMSMTLMRSATSLSVCVFMVKGYRAYNTRRRWPTDRTPRNIHLSSMEDEQRTEASDELFLLGCIAGLCNEKPRDELRLKALLLQLVKAQEARQRPERFPE